MFVPNQRRLSRRRFVSLTAGLSAAALLKLDARAGAVDVTLNAPFFAQGNTGTNSGTNCGMATVAAAVNYSGVAYPSVMSVRATLGMDGPTSLDQWAWLLDAYGVPWYPTFSQPDMELAIRSGHVMVIAAWMADLSASWDFELPWAQNEGQSGRYASFAQGHAMLVTGIADGGANYLVHDPNVFPGNGVSYYGDGNPKGAFRRYPSSEIAYTVNTYAAGLALAVASITAPPPDANAEKRIATQKSKLFAGPGGGHAPERGERGVTGEIVPASEKGVISTAEDDGEE